MIKMLKILKGNWSTILMFLLIVGIGGYIYLQNAQIEELKGDLSTANQKVGELTTSVQVQKQTISTIENQFKQTIDGTEKLNSEIVKLREEQNEIQAEYNSYRERLENATAQRPETISRLANRAFNQLLRDFERYTDRQNQPDEQPNSDTGKTSQDTKS